MRSSNVRSVHVLATAAAAAAALAFSTSRASAQIVWDGDGNQSTSNLNWNTAANWNPNVVPGNNAAVADDAAISANLTTANRIILFGAAGPVNVTSYSPLLPGAYRLKSLSFDNASAGQTTIGATPEATATLIFDNGGLGTSINVNGTFTGTAANAVAIRAPMVLAEQLTLNVAPRSNGAIVLNFLAGTGNEQPIEGPGGMTKNGLGVVSFADSPKNFGGPLIVNEGRVRIQGALGTTGALPSTSAVTVNPRIVSGNQVLHTVANILDVPESGQIQFDTAETNAGNNFGNVGTTVVTLNGGGMFDAASGLIGAIRVEVGRQTTMQNNVVLAGNSILSTAASGTNFTSQLTLAGNVSGPGMLISNDHSGGFSGTLVLGGNNSYTGGTMINNGTVTVNTATGLGNSANSPLIVNNINTVQAGRNVTLNLFNGSATSVGSLSGKTSTPTSAINSTTINNPSGLIVNQTTDGTFDGQITGAGAVTKGGSATLTLSGANNYTGITTINGGRLQATKAAALANNGTPGAVIVNNGATLGVNAGAPSGEWTEAEINTAYTNATFAAGSGFAIDTTGGNFSYGSSMGKANSLTKLGANTLTLTAANTYTGGTAVNAGTLVLGHADATAGGSINVANGAVAQAQAGLPKAVTVSTLNTNTSGKFDVTNNSMVVKGMTDAQVRTQLQAGYNGGAWNGATGITSSAVNSSTSVGYASNTSLGLTEFKGVSGLTGSDVIVKYTYAGDANLDGKVDIGDLGLLAGAWQQLTGKVWFDGDFTYDGAVNIGDLGLLAGNWQKGTAGNPSGPLMDFNTALAQFSAFDGVAVPEPASLSLLALGAAGLLGGRRRRRTA